MKSDSSKGRVTISGVRDDVLDRFDALADAEDKSRSEKLVELMEGEVAEAIPDGSGNYLPTDAELRRIYEAALEVATMPNHSLRFDLRGGELAQKLGLSKSAVRGHLFRLESRGYIRHKQGRVSGAQNCEFYYVKPECANPKVWKYSRVRDLDAVRKLRQSGQQDTSEQMEAMAEAKPEVPERAD
jgi:DNA-binding transcriptional ArsR family regulator